MKQATRMIKDILKLKYPDKEFRLKYSNTKEDTEIWDKLTISCEKDMDLDEVVSHVSKYIAGIVIYKGGDEVPPIDREPNKLMSIATYNWVEMNYLEFIEVR